MVIGLYIQEVNSPLLASMNLLAEKFPGDRYILFTDNIPAAPAQNCKVIAVSPAPKNKLLKFYWYSYKLPSLLAKNNADAFISDAGMLNTKINLPQFLFCNDNNLLNTKSVFLRKQFVAALLKAQKIFTTADYISDELQQQYQVPAEKLCTVYHGIQQNEVAVSADLLKEKFTEGNDYYCCPVSASAVPDLITLLKAFSQFKKRQKTSMQLVLLPDFISDEELIPDFKNYKYRDDVKIIAPGEKNADALIQYAYALIFLCGYERHEDVLKALSCYVPVVAEDTPANRSLFGNSALFSPVTDTSLAECMQLLYKDESVKHTLNSTAQDVLQKYDAEVSALSLRNGVSVQKTVIPLKKISE